MFDGYKDDLLEQSDRLFILAENKISDGCKMRSCMSRQRHENNIFFTALSYPPAGCDAP